MGGKSEGGEGRRAAISSAWHPVCGLGLHTMLRGRGPAGPTHIPRPTPHLFKLLKPQTGWDARAPFLMCPRHSLHMPALQSQMPAPQF